MKSNDNVSELRREAAQLIATSRQLDYQGIAAHRPDAVAALKEAIRALRLELPAQEPSERAPSVQERRRRYVEALSHAGLGDRLGKLYCSAAAERVVPFREVPHKRGLPGFDMVVAADFAPLDGYHGIFIAAQEIFSCVLPLPADESVWQMRERARYADSTEMVDKVAAFSAGFPAS